MKFDATSTETIDAYIDQQSPETQVILRKIRETISKAAPTAEEAIKYRMPTFVLSENLVHFESFANHIGFYPTPSGISQFQDELSKFKSAKGSVQFPLDQPIPYSLIKKIVMFRVKEIAEKQATKRGKK